MARSNFKPDSKGFQALAVSAAVRAAVEAEAERAKAIAVAMSEDFRTGEAHPHYADAFDTRTEDVPVTTRFGVHTAAAGVLENTSDHALAVEFGNDHDPKAHHILGKTRDLISNV